MSMEYIVDGVLTDRFPFFHCLSYRRSAEVGSGTCVRHRPLVGQKTVRVWNEDGALTGSCPLKA